MQKKKKPKPKYKTKKNPTHNHFLFQISLNDEWYHPSPECVYYFSRTFSLTYLYFQLTPSSPGEQQQLFIFIPSILTGTK